MEKRSRAVIVLVGLIVFLCLLSRLANRSDQPADIPDANGSPEFTEEPSDTPAPSITPSEQPTSTSTPTSTPSSPEEQLQADIIAVLGDNNRGIERISEYWYDPEDGLIYVRFAINDNLTDNLRRYGAKADVLDILEQVSHSSPYYSGIDILGTFSMVDQYGNISESVVISLYYSRETIERINFENMLTDNVYAIADNVGMIHTEFRE